MNRHAFGFVSFYKSSLRPISVVRYFNLRSFFSHMGGRKKEKQLPFPRHTKEGWITKKTVGVEGEDEWRVVGEEILSFPAHNVLVSMTGQLQICFILLWLCVCGNGRLPVNWSLWSLLSHWASMCCPSRSSFHFSLCCALQFLLRGLVGKCGSCLTPVVIFLFVIHLNQQIAILRRREGEKKEVKINLIQGSPVGRMTRATQRNDWYFRFCAGHKRGPGLFDLNHSIYSEKQFFLSFLHICTAYIISNSYLIHSHWYNSLSWTVFILGTYSGNMFSCLTATCWPAPNHGTYRCAWTEKRSHWFNIWSYD